MAASSRVSGFVKSDAFVGVLLLIAAVLALLVSNSALASTYQDVLQAKFRVGFENAYIDKALVLWINDGLMAIFFLYVGLEVKREFLTGKLSSFNAASLPLVGAIGGMAAPALIYTLIIATSGAAAVAFNGWAIPAAAQRS